MNFPDRKYQVIVVDPPWDIKKLTHKSRPNQTFMDYPTMTTKEIMALPVGRLADNRCWLFLWSIQKYLFESRKIIEAWGFNFLATGVWEKTYGRSAGMPLFGFRWNAEFILIGYKQKPDLWPKRSLIPLVFQAENIKHSQKPDKFYDMIAALGDSRLDIFARKTHSGWDALGNEVDGTDIKESLELLSQYFKCLGV